jgi:hypothetical protein
MPCPRNCPAGVTFYVGKEWTCPACGTEYVSEAFPEVREK